MQLLLFSHVPPVRAQAALYTAGAHGAAPPSPHPNPSGRPAFLGHLRLQDVKAGLEPHFVDHYDQIYRLAFQPDAAQAAAADKEAVAAAA